MQIRKKIREFTNRDIIKVTSWTSVATVIKMFSTFLMSKILAIYVGPQGLMVLGHIWNSVTLFNTTASGGLNIGIVKFTSEHHSNSTEKEKVINTAYTLTIICSVLTGCFLVLSSVYLSKKFLNTDKYYSIFLILGITILFSALNNFIISVINGNKDYRLYTRINIASSLVMLIMVTILTYCYNLYGALIATVLFQSVVFLITIVLIYKNHKQYFVNLKLKIDTKYLKNLFSYSLLSIIPAIIVPISQILIRNYISKHISMEKAGMWEAMNRISTAYLMFFTSTIGVYYLPLLSETQDKSKLKSILLKTFKIIIPLLILVTGIVFILREYVIKLLFSDRFSEIQNLFIGQLLGDIFKMSSWVLVYVLIAKKFVRSYIILEIVFNVIYVLLSIFFLDKMMLKGASIAYFLSYFIYFVGVYLLVKKYLYER